MRFVSANERALVNRYTISDRGLSSHLHASAGSTILSTTTSPRHRTSARDEHGSRERTSRLTQIGARTRACALRSAPRARRLATTDWPPRARSAHSSRAPGRHGPCRPPGRGLAGPARRALHRRRHRCRAAPPEPRAGREPTDRAPGIRGKAVCAQCAAAGARAGARRPARRAGCGWARAPIAIQGNRL